MPLSGTYAIPPDAARRRPDRKVASESLDSHKASIGMGSAGKYFVTCDACDFNPEWTSRRDQAERWAAEHTLHPDRDVSGIWAWSRWRSVRGVNHAWPFGTAPCGKLRTVTSPDVGGSPVARVVEADGPADAALPMCPVCVEMAPPDRELPPT